jgi:hypothetical protein
MVSKQGGVIRLGGEPEWVGSAANEEKKNAFEIALVTVVEQKKTARPEDAMELR